MTNFMREANMGYSQQLYDVLDGHYESYRGDLMEDYLRDEVYQWLMNDRRLNSDITNKRRPVYSVVWDAMLSLFNYYTEEEIGKGFRVDSGAVKRWFKRHGADFKEVLAPTVATIEQLRSERLSYKDEGCGKKRKPRKKSMKEEFGEWGDEPEIVASYYVGYEEPDGSVYSDGAQFHIAMYEDGSYSWSSEALDMTSEDFFDTEEEAYDDAEMWHQPDDGSELIISEYPIEAYDSDDSDF